MVGGDGDAEHAAGAVGDGKAVDTLVLLDTMLVSSYMQCSPPRHSALVRPGHCDEHESRSHRTFFHWAAAPDNIEE